MPRLPDRRVAPGRNRELHEQEIDDAATQFAQLLGAYIDRQLERLVVPVTRWWTGRCTGVQPAARRAQVRLEPWPLWPGALTPASWTIDAEYDPARFGPDAVLGRAVRVAYDGLRQAWWLDDVISEAPR